MVLKTAFLHSYFGTCTMNWNPDLFQYQVSEHFAWTLNNSLTTDDKFSLADNPQFLIDVDPSSKGGSLWVLLNRHVVKKVMELEEYITLHVFETNKNQTRKKFYSTEPKITGIYRNSPYYLATIDIPASNETTYYTIVIGQSADKRVDMNFTLEAYCTLPIKMQKANYLPIRKRIASEWTTETSGGALHNSSFKENPKFKLTLQQQVPTTFIHLNSDCNSHLNIAVFSASMVSYRSVLLDSGDYRKNYAFLELPNFAANEYIVVPSTFNAGDTGKFWITVETSSSFTLEKC